MAFCFERSEQEIRHSTGRKNILKWVAAFCLSACAALGSLSYIKLLTEGMSKSIYGSIFLLPLVVIYWMGYRLVFSCYQKAAFYRLTGIISLLFAFLLFAGAQLDYSSDITGGITTALKVLCLTAALFPLMYALTKWLDRQNEVPPPDEANRNATVKKSKKTVRVCFVAIVAIWFLGYLAIFPGVYGYDAGFWYLEWDVSNVQVTSKFSIVYTYLFHAIVSAGYRLSGNYVLGFAVFSALQMIFTLYAVWRILHFLDGYFKSPILVILSSAFFALVPTHLILTLSSAQDAPFTTVFAICIIHLLEMGLNPDSYWNTRKWMKLSVWIVFLCLLRGNGLFALLLMLPFILLYWKKYRRKLLLTCLIPITAVLILQGPVLTMFGVQKDDSYRDMLGVPVQQLARVQQNRPNVLTEQDKSSLYQYLPEKGLSVYKDRPSISDTLQFTVLNMAAVRKSPLNFWKTYFSIGLKAPDEYLKAAMLNSLGLWYPDKTYPDMRMYHPWMEYNELNAKVWNERYIEIPRESLFPQYDRLLSFLFAVRPDLENGPANFTKFPFLAIFCKAGIYFFLLVYLLAYGIYKRWKNQFIVIGLLIGLTVTILLASVSMYRYYAPVIFSAPLMVSMLFESKPVTGGLPLFPKSALNTVRGRNKHAAQKQRK